MHAHRISISVLLLSLLAGSLALAEESTIKQDAKQVGRETGEVVHKISEGGKEAGKKVAETARDVGHATRDAAVEIGHATRDGAKELGKAARGETSTASHSSASANQHKAQ
jgi:hypothetical protein